MLGGEGCRAICLSCFPYSQGSISETWEDNNHERISSTVYFLPLYLPLRPTFACIGRLGFKAPYVYVFGSWAQLPF